MCMSVRPRGKLMTSRAGEREKNEEDELNPPLRLEVELRDRSLSARVRALVVDALAVALHLG